MARRDASYDHSVSVMLRHERELSHGRHSSISNSATPATSSLQPHPFLTMDGDAHSSHSPSPSRDIASRPAARTYGRRRTIQDTISQSFEPQSSATTLVEPSSSNTTLARQSSVSSGDDGAKKKGSGILDGIVEKMRSADDGDDNDGNSTYAFRWREKLQAMNEDDEEDYKSPFASRSSRDTSRVAGGTSPSSRDATGNTSPRGESQEFWFGSIPPLTQSPSARPSQPSSVKSLFSYSMDDASPIPRVPSATRRAAVVRDSDPDSDEELPAQVSRPIVSSSLKRVQPATRLDSEDEDVETYDGRGWP
ncbi:hypothetical protein NEOLEDRAFT_1131548 [Neolentinus lepideus HHB14362 ss-1]|uniref:Uncharacterized protein n=1 Tax=Neolentinus lepideus HHB14362 ss-1 TaxID=1314782 RepID=A0A165TQT1_9AGAM|nr:hypothetical protein NEOLEDRAFT_1131548 [Neolentinus lepideus HHB14362 ss-1]